MLKFLHYITKTRQIKIDIIFSCSTHTIKQNIELVVQEHEHVDIKNKMHS